MNQKLYMRCKYLALRVPFLTTVREIELYTMALYEAIEWAEGIDKKEQTDCPKTYPVPFDKL